MNAIEVDGLRKAYGAFEAVRGITFDVPAGEVFAFLGPNGAGKTTTVEILEGYRRRTGGDVRVLGFDPSEGRRDLRTRIGIVLQECGFPRYATVDELLHLHAAYYPAPRPVGEVMGLVNLAHKRDAMIRTLSGGERRRLDLALALVGDPDLVFLDEPTTGFDPSARRDAWEAIVNLRELGKTIFLTTHYMDEAQYLADRVAVIAGGEIVAEGSPSTLGGRHEAETEIRFTLPPGTTVHDLPPVDGPAPIVTGSSVLLRVDRPTSAVHQLTSWAVEQGHELENLSVSQPTLEDVYLQLTASASETVTETR